MKKIVFIYTNPRFMTALYSPVFSQEYDNKKDVEVNFMCDQSLLLDTLKNNVIPTESVKTRLKRLIANAIEAKADCVVVACTTLNLAVDESKDEYKIPVLSIDSPLEEAIKSDNRKKVAILTHALDNGQTIKRELDWLKIESDIYVVDGAKECLGIKDNLEKCYIRAIEQIKGYDAIALGHVSADKLQLSTDIPIYRSGELCIKKINEILGIKEG